MSIAGLDASILSRKVERHVDGGCLVVVIGMWWWYKFVDEV